MKKIYILGGGTFNHVRNHLALAAPAFGETARQLKPLFEQELSEKGLSKDYQVEMILTKMADHTSNIVTNKDVEIYIEKLIASKDTKAIIFNVALTDFEGMIDNQTSG